MPVQRESGHMRLVYAPQQWLAKCMQTIGLEDGAALPIG